MIIENKFNSLQNKILFAILRGNSNLLEQLLQTKEGKSNFVKTCKENSWIFDLDVMSTIFNSPTALSVSLNSSIIMNIIANNSTAVNFIINNSNALNSILTSYIAVNAIANSEIAIQEILNSDGALQSILNSAIGKNVFLQNYNAMRSIANNSTSINTILSSNILDDVINSSTTMSVISNNSTAMHAIANNPTIMNAIANNSTAMHAIANNSTAVDIITSYSNAVDIIVNSSVAMHAIANNSAAMEVIVNKNDTVMYAIANSSTAMKEIVRSQLALDKIFTKGNARNIFVSSNALSRKEVPQMVSNTAPEGQASVSSTYGTGYEAFRAFDKNQNSWWRSADGVYTNQWVRYSFIVPVFVHTVKITNYLSYGAKNIKIQYSPDGITWIDATNVITLENNETEQTFYIGKIRYFQHWRIFIIDGYSTSSIALREVNFIGFLQP